MNRPKLAVIAVVLIATGVTLSVWPPGAIWEKFGGSCWKIGTLVGLFWFAYPQLVKLPFWLPPMLLVSIPIVYYSPKMIVWVLLVAVILYFIDPKKRRWSATAERDATKPNRPSTGRKREV